MYFSHNTDSLYICLKFFPCQNFRILDLKFPSDPNLGAEWLPIL